MSDDEHVRASMKTVLTYAAAVIGYIVLGLFTKQFLTWTWGPIYYITVLELVPRSYAAMRRRFFGEKQPVLEPVLKP